MIPKNVSTIPLFQFNYHTLPVTPFKQRLCNVRKRIQMNLEMVSRLGPNYSHKLNFIASNKRQTELKKKQRLAEF